MSDPFYCHPPPQTPDKLFLVSDYCSGGELFHHLRRHGLVLEEAARVYLAEILLALEYLHGAGIVHRRGGGGAAP